MVLTYHNKIMANILGISEVVGLALHTVDLLGKSDRLLTTAELAGNLEVSVHHLAKVHQRLVKSGLLVSTRGPAGGFQLARLPEDIRLVEIIESVQGPFHPNTCLLGRDRCIRGSCMLGGLARQIHNQIRSFFEMKTVKELIDTGNEPGEEGFC